MTIREYVDCKDPDVRQDYEEHIFENVFSHFAETLKLNPAPIDTGDGSFIPYDVWTDGVEILCRDEQTADMIADFLDAVSGEHQAHTGYYDPVEDARSGETDDHTGWWYVDYD